MGNPTNPNRVVRVKDLNRFKTKSDALYATRTNVSSKADKVSGSGLNDMLAALNSNGNLKSSGKKATDFAAAVHTHSQYADHYEVVSEKNRAMAKEAYLQQQLIRPVNMDALTPSSVFAGNDCVAINGVFYRSLRSTSSFPVTLAIQNGQFVYNESPSGHKAYVVADGTLNADWEVWCDSSIDFWMEYFDQRLDTKLQLDSEIGGYTVRELLEYVASLMAAQ